MEKMTLDELEVRSETAEGEEKARLLLRMAALHRMKHPEKTIAFANEALQIALQLGQKPLEVNALNSRAMGYFFQSDYSQALDLHQQALTLAEQIEDDPLVAKTLHYLGYVYLSINAYDQALNYFYSSLKISESRNDSNRIAEALNNIGTIYQYLKEFNQALNYYYESLRYYEKIGDQHGVAQAYNNLGVIYDDLEQPTKALAFFEQSVRICEESNDVNLIGEPLLNIAMSQMELNNDARAEYYFQRAMEAYRETSNTRRVVLTLINLGDLYLKTENHNKVLPNLRMALDLITPINDRDLIMRCHHSFASYYEAVGDFENAYNSYKQYAEINQELFHDTLTQKIADVQTQYEFRKKERETSLLKEQNDALQREIEERQQVEKALRESEDKYRQLFELESDAIFLIENENNLIIEVNSAASKLYGYTREELLTMHNFDLSAEPAETKRAVRNHHRVVPIRYHKKKDGTVFPVEITGSFFTWRGQEVHIAAIRDITERLASENMLIEKEHRLVMTQRIARLGSWSYDPETGYMEWSEETFKILGQTSVGSAPNFEDYLNTVHPDDRALLRKNLKMAIQKGEPYEIELRHLLSDGSHNFTLTRAQPIVQDGQTVRLLGSILDITERKKAELALIESEHNLREANATKDKFFSLIAHDLRNPLSSLMGYSEILLSQEVTGEAYKTVAKNINHASHQLHHLLENLLEWSRAQTSSLSFEPDWFQLTLITNEVLPLLMPNATAKGIQVTESVSPDLRVFADQNMIKTVLRNLLTNAIKFTAENGEVHLAAHIRNNAVEVAVSDTGTGISPENQKKLFQLHVKHTQKGTSHEKGTGLGLLLCKEFVEHHGGRIWFSSESGMGSTFYFSLPIPDEK